MSDTHNVCSFEVYSLNRKGKVLSALLILDILTSGSDLEEVFMGNKLKETNTISIHFIYVAQPAVSSGVSSPYLIITK